MDKDNGGCLKWVGYVVAVIFLFLWLSNVETIRITQEVPPPQDSWSVVYPQFRDDVSAQLLNTQEMVGIALNEVDTIKRQNSSLQYSVDILLSDLGIMQARSAAESQRQRREQYLLTAASVLAGWLLAAIAPTQEAFRALSSLFSPRRGNSSLETVVRAQFDEGAKQTRSISYWQVITGDPFARLLGVLIILVFLALTYVLVTVKVW